MTTSDALIAAAVASIAIVWFIGNREIVSVQRTARSLAIHLAVGNFVELRHARTGRRISGYLVEERAGLFVLDEGCGPCPKSYKSEDYYLVGLKVSKIASS